MADDDTITQELANVNLNDVTTVSMKMSPELVKILALSNMLTIKEVGRLGQTCREYHSVLLDDGDREVWASILNFWDPQFPYKEVIAAAGGKWIIMNAILNGAKSAFKRKENYKNLN